MKYALIGCGRIATNHIKAALNNQLEIAAVCDIVPEHMDSLLKKHELENISSIKKYVDYKTMRRSPTCISQHCYREWNPRRNRVILHRTRS